MRIEPRTATFNDEGTLTIEFAVTADGPDSLAVEPDETPAATSNDESNATDLPVHRNPDKLQAVYETNETSKANKEALDIDGIAQTVRRNMIKHGFHE